jgi:hypothetical protein
VHRGTPWQTVYLKATDVLNGNNNVGINTWSAWTGNYNISDAALMAPINDRRLAGLLMSLLNTKDATQLFSVNDSKVADWLNVLNGLTVYSNSAAHPSSFVIPQFDTYVMASNSLPTLVVANGIFQIRASQPNQNIYFVGDILAVPELTENSPWLNIGNTNQIQYDITDAEYEAIPDQLLPLLRPDSFGILLSSNGGWSLQFSGSDSYAYLLQTSTNLVSWNVVSTNYPVQGSFKVPIPSASNSGEQFYRTVLLP